MRNSIRLAVLACVLLVLSCYGCASRPDEQLKVAAEAMNQAMEQQADQYAPNDWKSAKEVWDQAQDQLSKQNYSKAAASLITAKARFLKTRDIAKDARDARQKEVKDLMENIASHYTALKAGVAKASLSAAAKKQFQSAFADIDKEIGNVNTLVAAGDFIQAKKIAQECLQRTIYNEKKLQGK